MKMNRHDQRHHFIGAKDIATVAEGLFLKFGFSVQIDGIHLRKEGEVFQTWEIVGFYCDHK